MSKHKHIPASGTSARPAKKTPVIKKTFNIGDRVKFDPPIPSATSCIHGQVVYYHGKHDPRNPRVRWNGGWGTTCQADRLTHLTEHEVVQYEPVTLVDCDIKH